MSRREHDNQARAHDDLGFTGPRGHRRRGPAGPDGPAGPAGPPWAAAADPLARFSGRGGGPGGPGRGRGRGRGRFAGAEDWDWGTGGPFAGRGPRAARGDVRAAILTLLAEEPMHGYQIMREIRERSGGVWKPSPGSVYPTLQQLEDEDLVAGDGGGGKKVFQLTESGRAAVAAMPTDATTPWHDVQGGVDPAVVDLRKTVGQVATAVMQVVQVGTSDQLLAAQRILADTRRQIYRLLAEEEDDAGAGTSATTDPAPTGDGPGTGDAG